MKSVSTIIWILCGLLVIATLDALPDPPAVNPSTAQCKVLQLHVWCCDTVSQPCESLSTSYPLSLSLVAADRSEPYRPSDRMVHAGLATDSSPPAPRGGRKPCFQS